MIEYRFNGGLKGSLLCQILDSEITAGWATAYDIIELDDRNHLNHIFFISSEMKY